MSSPSAELAPESNRPPNDVIIIGAGPAGLSAALVLGRCRRKVLVFDHGKPRNAAARHMHGFLTRDGEPPKEVARIAREQLRTYPEVKLVDTEVVRVARGEGWFSATLADGTTHRARVMLLATGLHDKVPALEGIERFYGASVHHCPYCDGWEHRDQTIAVYGQGTSGADLALEMLGWTRKVVLCTDGPMGDLPSSCGAKLQRYGVRIIETPIARLEGEGEQISGVRFQDGELLPCGALFFAAEQEQTNNFAEQLGCQFCEAGTVEHDDTRAINVPGLYVAGNTSRGLQLVIMAAASGTLAAFNINQALLDADEAAAIGQPPE